MLRSVYAPPKCLTSFLVLSLCLSSVPVYANPEGGVVASGSATISAIDSKTLEISQTTQKAIIDWSKFNIAADELTRFIQPNSGSITLNRVHDINPSYIAGRMEANGRVVLINPNGVFFSSTAQIDVQGLVASSADIDNDAFMSGSGAFDRAGSSSAQIINEGQITAREAGLVGFVAPYVENRGQITARLGAVSLAAGDTATIDLYGDGLIEIAATDSVAQTVAKNSGTIDAAGGTVRISAADGRNIINSLVDVSGRVSAVSVDKKTGKVTIGAKRGTKSGVKSTTLVSGTIEASGKLVSERGGDIVITGDNIGILNGALIDATGATGGGQVLIGGDYQGQGDIETASMTIVQSGSLIDVSALDNGTGGRAIIWADDQAIFAGSIRARGGDNGGDGGFVETSGKNILTAVGEVDASSPLGAAGAWLLDPNNITIQTAGSDTNVTGNPNFTTTNNTAIVTVASIQNALNAGTSVTVTTGASGTNSQTGDITVANSITKSSGGAATLSLLAHGSINFSANAIISSVSDILNVVLNADSDASGFGAISMASGSRINSNGGNITLGGGADPLTSTAKGTVGVTLNNAQLNAAGGNVSIRGQGVSGAGSYGVYIYGGSIVSTTGLGTVLINGTGNSGASNSSYGVRLSGATTRVSTEAGALNITATAPSTGSAAYGFYSDTGAYLQTTSGDVNVTGNWLDNYGIVVSNTTVSDFIRTQNGNVSFISDGAISLLKGNIVSTNGSLFNVTLNADRDADASGGVIDINALSIITNGGDIVLGGGVDPVTGFAQGVSASATGAITIQGASLLHANGGDISIHGLNTYTGGADDLYGVLVMGGSVISTTGLGTIDIAGTGGAGTSTSGNDFGVYLTGAGTRVTSEDGDINILGVGRSAGGAAYAVYTSGGSYLQTTSGDVNVTGNWGDGYGVVVNNTTVSDFIKTESGNVNLVSDGAISLLKGNIVSTNGSLFNVTLNADRDADASGGVIDINALSIITNGGDIVLGGGVDPVTGFAQGVSASATGAITIQGASLLHANGGDISIHGLNTYTGSADNLHGVLVMGGSVISTTGLGTIDIAGTGGAGNASSGGNIGVYLTGAGTRVTSEDGDINILGIGRAAGSANYGVYSLSGAYLQTTSGDINITGNWGDGYGIVVGNTTASNFIRTEDGNVNLVSDGAISLLKGNIVSTNGSLFNVTLNADRDADASGGVIDINALSIITNGGDIVLGGGVDPVTGFAQGVSASATGAITIQGASLLHANGGDISIHGLNTYTGSADNLHGVLVMGGSVISTTGLGTIDIAGTGGAGNVSSGGNMGVYLTGAGTRVTSEDGDINILGIGRAAGASNHGVFFYDSASIGSTGDGVSTITARGSGSSTDYVNGGTAIALGGVGYNGDYIFNVDTLSWGTTTLTTTGAVTFRPDTASTTIGVAGGTGTMQLTSALLSSVTTGEGITIGRFDGTGAINVSARTWSDDLSILSGTGDIQINGAQNMGSNTFFARTHGSGTGDININSGGSIVSNAANTAVTIVSSNNFNNTSTLNGNAIQTPSGRWLIYLSGADKHVMNGLQQEFRLFNCNYGGVCPSIPAIGDGILYANDQILTVTPVSISDIIYGSAAPNLSNYAYVVSGYLDNDGLTDVITGSVSGTTNYVMGSSVGTYAIYYSADTLVSSMGYSFAFNSNASAFNVLKRDITASVNNRTITYGTANPTLTAASGVTWNNLYSGDTGAVIDSVTFDYDGATPGAYNNVGTHSLSLTGFSDNNYNLVSSTAGTLTINPYTLNVYATNKVKEYGDADPTLTYTYGALQNGDTDSIFAGSLTRTAGENAGYYTISRGGLGLTSSNYVMNFHNGTLTINPYTLDVYATNRSKSYGGSDPSLTYTYGMLRSGDTAGSVFSGSLIRAAGENAGTYAITQGALAVSSNYAVTFHDGTFTINPYTLDVYATDKAKDYGDADPTLTYTYASLRNGDTDSIFSGAIGRVAGENAGYYAINQGALDAGSNYNINFHNGTLTINPYTLDVYVTNQSKDYGSTDSTLGYTYSMLRAGDTAGSVFSGNLVRASGENVGTYAVTQGSLVVSSNYITTFHDGSLTINPYTLNVYATDKVKEYGDADPTLTYTYGTLQNGDTDSIFTGALIRTAGESVGGYTISDGTLDAGSNYNINFHNGTLTINPYTLDIYATSYSKGYGEADSALTYTYTGLRAGDTAGSVFSGNLIRASGENAGTYAITQGGLSVLSSNYDVAFHDGALTITPYVLNIYADDKAKDVGEVDPVLTYTYGPLVGADTASIFSGALTRDAGENVGPYAIRQGTLTAGSNYTFTFHSGIFSIRPTATTGGTVWGGGSESSGYNGGSVYGGSGGYESNGSGHDTSYGGEEGSGYEADYAGEGGSGGSDASTDTVADNSEESGGQSPSQGCQPGDESSAKYTNCQMKVKE